MLNRKVVFNVDEDDYNKLMILKNEKSINISNFLRLLVKEKLKELFDKNDK